MIHRYVGDTLGLAIVALAVLALANRRDPEQPVACRSCSLGLVIFQGLLGMWTVTLLLKPLIVVAHLLGGLATLVLLASLAASPPEDRAADARDLRVLGPLAACRRWSCR